jgi:hypothetical protein
MFIIITFSQKSYLWPKNSHFILAKEFTSLAAEFTPLATEFTPLATEFTL